MSIKPTLVAFAASLTLSACGGGTKQEKQPVINTTYTLAGKVIDGYVSGAKVWIDFNNNGVYDANEPTAISGQAGNYSLELTETQRQCAQYATLYVDVPVGAVDEDLGEITDAYQMVRPPVLEVITDASLLHISPLTTALWQGIEKELAGSHFSDCASLVADQAKREEVKQLIEATIYNTVSFFNISEEEIFEDFIAAGNQQSTEFAQKLVKGLQKSFSYTRDVEAQYPTATEVRVVHYFGSNAYYHDDELPHWFRDVVVFDGDWFYSREDLMSETLDDIIQPIYYRNENDSVWGEGTLTLTQDAIYRGQERGYQCFYSEQVAIEDAGVTYTLANNLPENPYVVSVEACQEAVFADAVADRTFTIGYTANGKNYLADLRQTDGSVSVLPDWVDFADRSTEFDFVEVVTELENSGYQFGEAVLIPANYWYKREDWYVGDVYYQITYNHLGEWEKYTRFKDGTHTDECSNDGGQTWKSCGD